MSLPDIQNQIISKLKNAAVLRYRDLQIIDIANDLFYYHLKALVKKGLVQKVDLGYTLSEEGKAFVADVHHTSDPQLQRLFKINVITILSRRAPDGDIEILSQRRNAQPSHGIVDVMGGTILKGESLLDGATRKLRDETGLNANFKLLGFERRHLYKDGKLFSDVVFPICYAESYSGELASTEFGDNFWVNIDQAIKNTDRPYDNLPSIKVCLQAIKENVIESLPLFYEETIQNDSI